MSSSNQTDSDVEEAHRSDDDCADDSDCEPRPYWKSSKPLELLACVVFSVLCVFPAVLPITPFQKPIPFQRIDSGDFVHDVSIDARYISVTVDVVLGFFLAAVLPTLIQLVLAYFWGNSGDFHATWCVYVTALGITMGSTEFIKLYTGYLRPGFYDLCQPNEDYSACTNDDTRDVRKAFPSGHASSAFCGLTLLTLYVHGRFGMGSAKKNNNNNAFFLRRLISVVALLPIALAVFISASRIRGNKHHPSDIVAGALLGGSVANYIHGLWI